MKTLRASLLASAIGMGAWMLDLLHQVWPAHPHWAGFFLTLAATIILSYVWAEPTRS